MSFGIFLNFEKLSLKIIEAEISQMTNDNVVCFGCGEVDEIDEQKFENNLYHGSIAATFIVNLYETTLNTILSSKLSCSEIEIFKVSHNVKLQLICVMYHADLATIKTDNSYGILNSIIKLRNDITHYKSNAIAEGHYITTDSKVPMGTSKESISKLFTKSYMENSYAGVLKLLDLICRKCGLVLYKDCQVIDCDGRDMLCEFVVTQEDYDVGKQNDDRV